MIKDLEDVIGRGQRAIKIDTGRVCKGYEEIFLRLSGGLFLLFSFGFTLK